jgi:hypothetical protein
MTAAHPTRRTPVTWWWFLIPLFTLGFTTFALVLVGGLRLRSRGHVIAAAGYLALTTWYFITPTGSPETSADKVVTGLQITVAWLLGTVHVAWLQRRVREAAGPPPVPYNADPALTAALARARRRDEARALAAGDPAVARDLHIGRPDAPHRDYDDGGLVDVNHVSAAWLCHVLELSPALADEIVRIRSVRNGFDSPDDLMVACDGLTHERLTVIRDRMIFIPR